MDMDGICQHERFVSLFGAQMLLPSPFFMVLPPPPPHPGTTKFFFPLLLLQGLKREGGYLPDFCGRCYLHFLCAVRLLMAALPKFERLSNYLGITFSFFFSTKSQGNGEQKALSGFNRLSR